MIYKWDNGLKHTRKNSNESYKIFFKHLLLITEQRISWSPDFYLGNCVKLQSGYAAHVNSFPHTFSSWECCGTGLAVMLESLPFPLTGQVVWWESLHSRKPRSQVKLVVQLKTCLLQWFLFSLSLVNSLLISNNWILLKNARQRGNKVFPQDTPLRMLSLPASEKSALLEMLWARLAVSGNRAASKLLRFPELWIRCL